MIVLLFCFTLLRSTASGENLSSRLFSNGSNDSPTSLANSAIGKWIQRSELAKRVCQRVVSVDSYDSSVSSTTASVVTGRCEVQMIKSVPGVQLEPYQKPCPGTQACVPTMSEVISLRTTNGINDVTSAISCTCAPRVSSCHRRRRLRVFYRNTKFERVVDVGECAGNCYQNKCQPLSLKSISIKSPNGRKSVVIVEKCACAHSCYRIAYKKAYLVLTEKRNSSATETKVIDIGRCSSSSICTGQEQAKCLYWVEAATRQRSAQNSLLNSSGKVCLLRTRGRPRGCYAKRTKSITLNTPENPKRKVILIKSCECS